jgi:endogenous inhibitor of DNA gyrase (YacG/DUF329 family)
MKVEYVGLRQLMQNREAAVKPFCSLQCDNWELREFAHAQARPGPDQVRDGRAKGCGAG